MTDLAVFGPVDDLIRGIFLRFFEGKGVGVHTEFQPNYKAPYVVGRRERRSGLASQTPGDERVAIPAVVLVNTVTGGPDADEQNDYLQEATRLALFQARSEQIVIPGCGVINDITNAVPAARVNDWATSTGVVQYASMPNDLVRYEAIYRLIIRPPARSTIINPFI